MRYHLKALADAVRDTIRIHRHARATHAAVRELRSALHTLAVDRREHRATAQSLAADLWDLTGEARAVIHAAGLGPATRPAARFLPVADIPPFARGLKPWTVYDKDGAKLGTVYLTPSMGPEEIRRFLGDPDTGPADITVHPGRTA